MNSRASRSPGAGRHGLPPVPAQNQGLGTRTDTYSCFSELKQYEAAGRDYVVYSRIQDPRGVVAAPHGGRIECHTAEIAREIAGDVLSCYAFIGTKAHGNRRLHITSHRFDEPRAVEIVTGAMVVLTVHGAGDDGAFVMIGGRDRVSVKKLGDALLEGGFPLRPPGSGRGGRHLLNICNRGKTRRGIQLELTAKLRRELLDTPAKLDAFARTVRKVMVEALPVP